MQLKWSAKQIESRITIYCFPIFDPFLYPQLFQLVCLEFSSRELAFLQEMGFSAQKNRRSASAMVCSGIYSRFLSKVIEQWLRMRKMAPRKFVLTFTKSLKITENVSFNIASEASYVYILSGQKLIKNAKNGQFWRVFENLKLAVKQCYQTGQF